MAGRKCPACGDRHGTAPEVRSCMADAVRRKRRNELREAFGLR